LTLSHVSPKALPIGHGNIIVLVVVEVFLLWQFDHSCPCERIPLASGTWSRDCERTAFPSYLDLLPATGFIDRNPCNRMDLQIFLTVSLAYSQSRVVMD